MGLKPIGRTGWKPVSRGIYQNRKNLTSNASPVINHYLTERMIGAKEGLPASGVGLKDTFLLSLVGPMVRASEGLAGIGNAMNSLFKKELARLKTPGHEEERQLVAELGLKVAEQRTFPAPHETNCRKIPKGLSQGGTVDCGDKSASRTHSKDGVRSTAVPSLSCGSRLALQLPGCGRTPPFRICRAFAPRQVRRVLPRRIFARAQWEWRAEAAICNHRRRRILKTNRVACGVPRNGGLSPPLPVAAAPCKNPPWRAPHYYKYLLILL